MSKTLKWNCPTCKKQNWPIVKECSCGYNRREKKEEWLCQDCGVKNHGYRSECYKCSISKIGNNAKNTISDTLNNILIHAGDSGWTCKQCKCNNLPTKKECRKCGFSICEPSSQYNAKQCPICFENEKNMVIKNCGHLCSCYRCILNINKCPICRTNFDPHRDVMKIYDV